MKEQLHRDFERALAETQLPERPNYEKANEFLIKARRQMVAFADPEDLYQKLAARGIDLDRVDPHLRPGMQY